MRWRSREKVELALEGYSRHCRRLYSELLPEEGALSFLDRCEAANTYVISGGAQDELTAVFDQHHIAHRFAEIRGSPTTKVDHLEEILAARGISPADVLFIGDGWTDFKTSKHFGTHFVFLKAMSDWQKHAEQMAGAHHDMVTECATWNDLIASRVE